MTQGVVAMRKFKLSREEITNNQGNVIMRNIKRIMTTAHINAIKDNLINLLNETLEDDEDNEIA